MLRFLAACFVLCVASTATAITRTWDGGAGTFSWQNALNWNPDGVPLPPDDVVIDMPGSITINFLASGTSIIHSLACAETLHLIAGTLSISAASTIHNLNFGGALTGSGDVTVDGTLNGPGDVSGSGHLIIAPGGILNLSGGPLKRVLDNYGTAIWQFNNMTFSGGPDVSVLNNYGTLNVPWNDALGILSMVGVAGSGGGVFNNFGTINKSGIGKAGFGGGPDPVVFNNMGTVNVLDGAWLMANGSYSGTFNLSGVGATRLFVGGSLPAQFEPTAQIEGPGNLRIRMTDGGSCNFFCPIKMTGNIDLAGGTIGFHGDVALGGIISIIESEASFATFDGPTCTAPNIQMTPGNSSSTLSFNSPISTVGMLNMMGGEMSGSGDVHVTESLVWGNAATFTGGTMSGTGRTIVDSSATLLMPFVSGTGQRKLNRILENHGIASMQTGSATIALAITDGELDNLGDFTITTSTGAPAQIQRVAGSANVNNAGTLVITGPGILQLTNANGGVLFNNTGTVNVDQGELWLSGGGSNSAIIAASSGAMVRFLNSFSHLPGSLLDGNGTHRFELGIHDLLGGVGPGVHLYQQGGTLTVHDPVSPASITVGATLFVEGDQYWTSLSLFNGGTIDGPGTLTLDGTTYLFGTMQGAGQTIVAPTATVNVSGNPALKRTLVNNGLLNWTIDNWDFTDGVLINNGVFNALPHNVLFPCRIRSLAGVNQFVNNGILNKDNSSALEFQIVGGSLSFDNHSTVNVNQGLMQIGCGGMGDGLFDVDAGASLKFTSDFVAGDVILNGGLSIATQTQLALSNSYMQSSTGLLQLAFNSDNQAAVTCEGDISLAGAIAATFSPPPPAFTVVPLLTSTNGTITGTFASIAFAPPGTIQYEKNAVTWTTFKPGDVNGDNIVNSTDLLAVINSWGNCPAPPASCPGDQNGDGVVNAADLLIVINNWD